MAAFVVLRGFLIVPVGTMGLLTWGWPFPDCGVACGLCPKSRAWRTRTPHLPRFILLVSFSDTLLLVSIVNIFVVLKGLIICCF